jgi:hypothetical protein
MDLAVLGGDPRSTTGGGSAATVLDAACDGTEMISASTGMGASNPKPKTSARIVEGLGWGARFLVKIGIVGDGCAWSEDARKIILPLVRNNFREEDRRFRPRAHILALPIVGLSGMRVGLGQWAVPPRPSRIARGEVPERSNGVVSKCAMPRPGAPLVPC